MQDIERGLQRIKTHDSITVKPGQHPFAGKTGRVGSIVRSRNRITSFTVIFKDENSSPVSGEIAPEQVGGFEFRANQ